MTQYKTTLINIANEFGSPCYVYDAKIIKDNFLQYQQAFANTQHQICYAVKANSNIHVLAMLAKLGSGFDVVSIGELLRVVKAGGNPKKVIFSGVGKTREEIEQALQIGIEAFDIESLAELDLLIEVATETNKVAPISCRFNPDVDAKTHPYISTGLKDNKFGLTEEAALAAYSRAKDSPVIDIVGINMHIGSQLTDVSALTDAIARQHAFIEKLNGMGITLKHINFGGGLGIKYKDENPISIADWVNEITKVYADSDVTLVIEPGRSIVGEAGVLLTKVIYTKSQNDNHFAVVDAGMNDYMRVALYQAHANIVNLSEPTDNKEPVQTYQVVGPVCESTDCFIKNAELSTKAGDLLAITEVGAYGFSMASTYNTRPLVAEVLIEEDGSYRLIRRRSTFEELIAGEEDL